VIIIILLFHVELQYIILYSLHSMTVLHPHPLLSAIVLVVLVVSGVDAKRRVLHTNFTFDSTSHHDYVDGGTQRRLRERGLDVIPTDREQHRVTFLPGLSEQDQRLLPVNYAGHLPCDTATPPLNFLFYWLFEKEQRPQEAPLTIWMNVRRYTAPPAAPHVMRCDVT
jgi:hypothetical protein